MNTRREEALLLQVAQLQSEIRELKSAEIYQFPDLLNKQKESPLDKFIGWLGAATGLLGAIILASNINISGLGYILFTISSFTLVFWSIKKKLHHQLAMQGGYFAINLFGLYRWLII